MFGPVAVAGAVAAEEPETVVAAAAAFPPPPVEEHPGPPKKADAIVPGAVEADGGHDPETLPAAVEGEGVGGKNTGPLVLLVLLLLALSTLFAVRCGECIACHFERMLSLSRVNLFRGLGRQNRITGDSTILRSTM